MGRGEVANAGRLETLADQLGRDLLPQRLVARAERQGMTGQTQEWPVDHHRLGPHLLVEQRLEHRRGPASAQADAQPLGLQAGRIGLGLMMGRERFDDVLARIGQRLGQEAEALQLGAAGRLQEPVHVDRPEIARLAEAAGLDEARFQPQQFRQHVGVGLAQRRELGQPALRAAIARGTERIDHHRAGDRAGGRGIAQDDTVAGKRADLVVEHELRQRRIARRQPVALEQRHPAHDVGRAEMDMHRRPVLERLTLRREQVKAHVGPPVAAADGVFREPRPGQVERAAFAGPADLRRAVLGMQRAHARFQPRRRQQQPVVELDLAGMDGARHHDAGACQHEAAVDGQSCKPRGALAAFSQRQQLDLQLVDTLPGQGRYRHDLRTLERCRSQQRLDLGHALEDLIVVGKVGLGHRDDAAIEAEQIDDLQMLDRLRLDALRCRHDKQGGVDAGGAGQHVVHEAFVARYVDEAQLPAVAQVAVGVAEIDGDAARLLFLQAIGVDAGQRFDERRLAVIDVACGADDHASPSLSSCATNAASSSRVRRSK